MFRMQALQLWPLGSGSWVLGPGLRVVKVTASENRFSSQPTPSDRELTCQPRKARVRTPRLRTQDYFSVS